MEKVLQLTALSKVKISPVIVEELETEIYFFVLPQTSPPVESVIVTSNYANWRASNLLMVKLLHAAEQKRIADRFKNVNFYGKIKDDSDPHLKRCISVVTSIIINKFIGLSQKAESLENYFFDIKELSSLKISSDSVIDLTCEEVSIDILRAQNENSNRNVAISVITSPILEKGESLGSFYSPEILGLRKGWDSITKVKQPHKISYDDILFNKWKSELHTDTDENLCGEFEDLLARLEKKNSEQKSVKSRLFSTSPKLNREVEQDIKIEAKTDKTKRSIKSNLFTSDQIDLWNKKSKIVERDHLIVEKDLEKQQEFNKTFKIPTFSGGTLARPVIFRSQKRIDFQTDNIMKKSISRLVDTDTPSKINVKPTKNDENRSSIRGFLPNFVINMTNDSNDDSAQQSDSKRFKLQPPTDEAKERKFFKNRKPL
jgi:hypothetical protein